MTRTRHARRMPRCESTQRVPLWTSAAARQVAELLVAPLSLRGSSDGLTAPFHAQPNSRPVASIRITWEHMFVSRCPPKVRHMPVFSAPWRRPVLDPRRGGGATADRPGRRPRDLSSSLWLRAGDLRARCRPLARALLSRAPRSHARGGAPRARGVRAASSGPGSGDTRARGTRSGLRASAGLQRKPPAPCSSMRSGRPPGSRSDRCCQARDGLAKRRGPSAGRALSARDLDGGRYGRGPLWGVPLSGAPSARLPDFAAGGAALSPVAPFML
jgi:hypothetical protein